LETAELLVAAMAFVERGATQIDWNSLGQGKPVVLVTGLGAA